MQHTNSKNTDPEAAGSSIAANSITSESVPSVFSFYHMRLIAHLMLEETQISETDKDIKLYAIQHPSQFLKGPGS